MRIRNIIKLSLGIMILGMVTSAFIYADDDDYDERHERDGGRIHKNERVKVVENSAYKNECASCHFLYPSEFLPKRSWEALMKGSDKHFGENLALNEKDSAEILSYLVTNSAEMGNSKWAFKILKSIGSTVPLRITEVPYILKEHRELRSDIFQKKSIGSFSNCSACHLNGTSGDFEEGSVRIPVQ